MHQNVFIYETKKCISKAKINDISDFCVLFLKVT